jgi:filamentous hemagglutinin
LLGELTVGRYRVAKPYRAWASAESTTAGASGCAVLYNRQLHQSEYDDAKRHAKTVAKELGISEQEAEGRIVAEIPRNSDKRTADASGGKHDWAVRSIVGCQNLNCDGYKNDPQYANHDYNGEYIEPNRASYDRGQGQLGSGLTDAELRQENLPYERLGKLAIAGGACLVSGPVGCKAAVSGFAATLGLSYLSSSPLTTAESIGGIYGGALGGIYGQALNTWTGGTSSVMQSGVLFVTKTGTIAAGKQIGVPLGNSTGLAQSVDPLFDPATNPWWGLRNTWGRFKQPSN